MAVQPHDSRLIRLRHVGEDGVDHSDKHAIAKRVTGVFDDGDDVCAVSGHVDEIAAGAVGEFHGVDGAVWTDDIRDVRDRSAGCGAEVEDFCAGADEDVFETAEDSRSQLRAEGVPHAVFGFCGWWCVCACCGGIGGGAVGEGGGGGFNGDAFLAVDGFAWGEVLGDEHVFFAAGNEDAGVTMGFDYNFCAS